MILPEKHTIEKVNETINTLVKSQGLSFTPEIKKDYCSLIPDESIEFSTAVLRAIRKQFKNVYIWISNDELSSNYSVNFFKKY